MQTFYFTLWRERHLGGEPLKDVMYFGEIGVTCSEFFIMGICLVAGVHPQGGAFFATTELGTVPLGSSCRLPVSLGQGIAAGAILLNTLSVVRSLAWTLHATWTIPLGEEHKLPLNMWGEFWSFFTYVLSFALLLLHDGARAWHPDVAVFTITAAGSAAAFLLQNIILYDMAEKPCDRFYMISAVHLAGSVAFVCSHESAVLVLTCVVCVTMEALWVLIMFSKLADKLNVGVFRRMASANKEK